MSSTEVRVSTSVIFSTPTAIATSDSPLATLRYALLTAALPLAHAASTLIVPTSSNPAYSLTTTAGRDSSYHPPALPSVTFWISFFCTPESSIAPLIDSKASSATSTSVLRPNLECPIPTMATSLNARSALKDFPGEYPPLDLRGSLHDVQY